ncbi:unnamed protein product, partial [Meganyctiphanes norvegica]
MHTVKQISRWVQRRSMGAVDSGTLSIFMSSVVGPEEVYGCASSGAVDSGTLSIFMSSAAHHQALFVDSGTLSIFMSSAPDSSSVLAAPVSTLLSCNASTPQQGVFVCRPGECVSLDNKCNGVPDCTHGEDEAVRECGCLPNEFQCGEECLDLTHRCDTIQDCQEGQDELGCETYVCPTTHFKCNNHLCIPNVSFCDFTDDCGDGSDELQCHHRECWKAEFSCTNGQCIRPGQVCDGHNDCKDGSDEQQCQDSDFRRCGSGLLVHRFYWCDGWPDCHDNHADELNCSSCSAESQFKCPNSRCISRSNVCDSFCDCASDCADEANCTSTSYTTMQGISLCEVGSALTCMMANHDRSQDRCIRSEFICDGSNDCHTGDYLSDEYGCEASCPPEQESRGIIIPTSRGFFSCENGRCLPKELHCDHKTDCLHGEDEFNCSYQPIQKVPSQIRTDRLALSLLIFIRFIITLSAFSRCKDGEWQCTSGQCIPENMTCDLKFDCIDKSDEIQCDHPRYCGHNEYQCRNGQCIPIAMRCHAIGGLRDGCADGSHLVDCGSHVCLLGDFKCQSGPCIHQNMVCNSRIDCPGTWDDEDSCPFSCSELAPQCECKDVFIDCHNHGMKFLPRDIEQQISRFNFSGNFLNVSIDTFVTFDRIIYLDLSNNSLTSLPAGVFANLIRLKFLDLRDNMLDRIVNSTFIGLAYLKTLHLSGNRLKYLDSRAFYGLSSLSTLDLSNQMIRNISHNAFLGLRTLRTLDLGRNQLESMSSGAFTGLNKLKALKLNLFVVANENRMSHVKFQVPSCQTNLTHVRFKF